MPPLISALVLVRNEEANLRLALSSLRGWVDEIVVVDGESTDGSVEVATSFGAKVFSRAPTAVIDADRPFGVAQCTGTWILHIDADEVVPTALGRALRTAAERDDVDVISTHEQSWFLGKPCNVWKGHKPRLFRRSALQTGDRIHKMYDVRNDARRLVLPNGSGMELQHYWTDGLSPLMRRLDRYSLVEAQQLPPLAGEPKGMGRKALRGFLAAYLRDGGWKRGWRGIYLSVQVAFYRVSIEARRAELAQGGQSAIRAGYRAHAQSLLADKQ